MFDVEDHGQAAYALVVRSELARRLPVGSVRVFAPFGPDRPTRADRGEPAEALGAWSEDRAVDLGGQLDAVVVGGEHLVAGAPDWAARYRIDEAQMARRRPERFFLDGPGAGAAVRWHAVDAGRAAALRAAGVEGPVDVTAHPAVLLDRVLPPAVLEKRLQYLRLMGWYPTEGGAVVVQGGSGVPAVLGPLRAVLADHPRLTPVVIELAEGDAALAAGLADARVPHRHVPASACLEDVAAAIAAATGFVGAAPAGCMVAACYGTPWAGLGATDPESLPAAFSAALDAGAEDPRQMAAEVDAWLDSVAAGAAEAAAARLPDGAPPAPDLTAMRSELRALRAAHRARAERASAERVVLADRMARAEAELAVLRPEAERLRERLEAEAGARAQAEAEIAALHATRTFRWTASAREVYRKAGGPRR